jgi:CubicO group peptidase (beta-lactamase class C family)
VFAYRLDRLHPLADAIRACTEELFPDTITGLLDRLAMVDSVPGADVLTREGRREADARSGGAAAARLARLDRYRRVLARLATGYVLDGRGRASAASESGALLGPAGGLISTARDLAQFDLAIKADLLLEPETLALTWRPPVTRSGQPLPHALGWFVRPYNGGTVVWQFGVSERGSSSLIVSAPSHWTTLILLANSDGLVRPFDMASGDLMASPFVRLFLSSFVR